MKMLTSTTANWSSVTSDDPHNCYPENIPEKKPIAILYMIIVILGIPSNCFSLFVSCQHIRQNKELGIYLFNLALADLCFIMTLPIWVDYTLKDQWQHGGTACTACVFLLFTHFYTSAALLCCISVDRYVAVVHPLNFLSMRRTTTAIAISVLMWVISITFSAVTVSLQHNYEDSVCLDVLPMSSAQPKVNIARCVIGFLIPAILVGFCSRGIYVQMKTNQAIKAEERKKVSRLLLVILLTLWLCFGPIHIILVLRALLEDCGQPTWLYVSYKVSVAISSLNCLADPLLYCFITRSGRASVTQVFFTIRRKLGT
ncbi:G protein-coupled receptor 65 [Denticeps clupeoides]|uniref:G protein-coupled receptor 65 n=1 Tax=Denticeps clupeoides TaxID=299321 RepID=A0AAY4ATL6_9TELE|nr:psychosine receptor [Denticeps clupeoides]